MIMDTFIGVLIAIVIIGIPGAIAFLFMRRLWNYLGRR